MSTAPKTKIEEVEKPTESELPEGWADAQVEQLSTLVTKGTTPTSLGFNYKNRGIPFVRVENLSNGSINRATIDKFIDDSTDEALSRSRLQSGDLLFSIAGTIGRTALVSESDVPANTNQALAIIRGTSSVLLPKFLMFALSSHLGQQQAESEARGGSMNNISLGDVRGISVPIPPLAEQERIVSRVKALQTLTGMSAARLSRISMLLKHFRQAVLAAACSGKLTEDWRETHPDRNAAHLLVKKIKKSHDDAGSGHGGKAADPTEDVHILSAEDLPKSWALEELKWLCEPGRSITYGILKPGPNQTDGVPYVRVADFPGDHLNLIGIKKTTAKIADEYRRAMLKSGDILLSIRGTVGRVCRVPAELDGGNITQDTARITVHQYMSARYLETYLRSPSTQKRLEAAMKGVAVRGINIGDVRVLQVGIPPLEEQHEIVRRVEALFKLADAIEKRVAAARTRADRLTQAVLAKAFRGELVPTEAELARREGRSYEPASVLLEKIKKERAAAETGNGKKRGKKRGKLRKYDRAND